MTEWPKHESPTRDDRTAHAPYNFVPLPDAVRSVDVGALPDHDRYYPADERHTGIIHCTLTNETPLYIRAGLKPDEYRDMSDDDQRNHPPFYYTNPATMEPVIPGSSLRGMIRGLVEIVSSGKLQWVGERAHYSYREIYRPGGSALQQPYRDARNSMYSGYVVYRDGKWYVLPLRHMCLQVGGPHFRWLKIREDKIGTGVLTSKLDEHGYVPAYIEVSFKYGFVGHDTCFPTEVVPRGTRTGPGWYDGWLICSGNMSETADPTKPFRSPKRHHWLFPLPPEDIDTVSTDMLRTIDEQAIADYAANLSDFQQQSPPFNKEVGCLRHGRPVFYQFDPDGVVRSLGHTRNYRVPYRRPGSTRTSGPVDYVPKELRGPCVDLSDAIFGHVLNLDGDRQRESSLDDRPKPDPKENAYASRVSFSDAHLVSPADAPSAPFPRDEQDPDAGAFHPRVLLGPKPTSFQHYLTQSHPDSVTRLSHYGTATPEESVIRGHKLYWHKPQRAVTRAALKADPQEAAKHSDVHTTIHPLDPGHTFSFCIRFENLDLIELGSLLWVLGVAADSRYRLKLGMGKPYGMGSVKLTSTLTLQDRRNRYAQLLSPDGESWHTTSSSNAALERDALDAFEGWAVGEESVPLAAIPRIDALLTMLNWSPPAPTKTGYMETDDFVRGPVLPDPWHVDTAISEHWGRVVRYDRSSQGGWSGHVVPIPNGPRLYFRIAEKPTEQFRVGDVVRFREGRNAKQERIAVMVRHSDRYG